MAETNDYVLPHLDGLPYVDKPIVYFAAAAVAIEALGPTETAARLPAYLFTLATLIVVAWFGSRRWRSRRCRSSWRTPARRSWTARSRSVRRWRFWHCGTIAPCSPGRRSGWDRSPKDPSRSSCP